MNEDQQYCKLCERYLGQHPELAEQQHGPALERLLELRRPSPAGEWAHTNRAGWELHQAARLDAGRELSAGPTLREVLDTEQRLGRRLRQLPR